MSIDWSKAPADATHFSPAFERFDGLWAKTDGSRWMYRAMDADAWHYGPHPCESESYIERPVWNGEGLPPVGTVCEMRGSGAWYQVKILGAGNLTALIEYCDGQEHAVPINSVTFRPIRTSEQIAADERSAAIEDMWKVYWQPDAPSAKQAFGLLWDAGYRKQVQP